MAYQYENDSPMFSRGYAETGRDFNKYNQETNTQAKSTGFADNLESQFYFDRPAVSQDRVERTRNVYEERTPEYKNSDVGYETQAQDRGYQQQVNNENSARYAYTEEEYRAREEQRLRYLDDHRYRPANEHYENNYAQEMSYTTDSGNSALDSEPSATTKQFRTAVQQSSPYDFAQEKNESVDKKYTINTKGKILIAVYALVVVTVFALIILNTRLLKSMNATSQAKEAQIAELSQEVAELHDRLDYVSSDEVIDEKAAEKGMVKG